MVDIHRVPVMPRLGKIATRWCWVCCFLLLINFVCLRVRISRVAIAQCQATPRPSELPGLWPCSLALSPWVLGKARLLTGTPFPFSGEQAASSWGLFNCSAPWSSELELQEIQVHTYASVWKGPWDICKAFNSQTLFGRAQAEPQGTRGLEGWRSSMKTPEMARSSCCSPPSPEGWLCARLCVRLTSYDGTEGKCSYVPGFIDHSSKGHKARENWRRSPQSHSLSTMLSLGGISRVGCAGWSTGGKGRNV